MWLKLGLSITAEKLRERLPYEVRGIYVNMSFSLSGIALYYCQKLTIQEFKLYKKTGDYEIVFFLQDWNYKMQLDLCNVSVRDIPKSTRSDIYDESIIYVILIHGAVEDCHSQKTYKAPFLFPVTCRQVKKY